VIRATLDVNVLASGFPAESGVPAELLARWANLEYELVLSEHILAGLARAWQKPYFRLRFSPAQANQAMIQLRIEAIVVTPS
jgi:predicted nucleic acid-binding protein